MTDKINKLNDELRTAHNMIEKLQTKCATYESSINAQTTAIANLREDTKKLEDGVNNNFHTIRQIMPVMELLESTLENPKSGIILP